MPTMAESGSTESRTYWAGVVAPAGTPRRRTSHNAALNRGLASQQVRERWPGLGRNRRHPDSQETLRIIDAAVVSGTKSLKAKVAQIAIEMQQIGQYALRGVQWSACRHIIPSVTNVE